MSILKKKIAIINVFFPPQTIGGATRIVSDNIDILLEYYRDRFELVVFTTDAEHLPRQHLTAYPYKGIRIYKTTVQWRVNMDWEPRDDQMGSIFGEFLDFEQPDMVHFHCIQRLTGSIVTVTQQRNIPYIVTAHDAWWISDYQFLVDAEGKVYPEGHPDPYAIYKPPEGLTTDLSIERRSYLKGLLGAANKVLCVSESFRDIYRKNGILKAACNRNGISSSMSWSSKVTDYTDKVVCAHIGGISIHKGYHLFKKAIKIAQPKNIEVLIVDHSQDEFYLKRSSWSNVPVTFIGRVLSQKVVDLYSRIDVLFAPSIWPESFGLVTREAVACGCWVVTSNIGAIGEDVIEGKNGYIIDTSNTSQLIEIVRTVDANPSMYKSPNNYSNTRKTLEQVHELVEIYEEILEKNKK